MISACTCSVLKHLEKTKMSDKNEINREEMFDLLEEMKQMYSDLREKYNTEDASDNVKNDFTTLDKMVSKFFGYGDMVLDEYLENLSDVATGIHYLELDLGLGHDDQLKVLTLMTLVNNFTNRCVCKYTDLFKK